MVKLGVNIDHVATLRQARGTTIYPDPVTAAALAELAGAHGITIHLREDRRHIQDRDLKILRQTVATKLNLEMAATSEMLEIAQAVKPDACTLVPEKRQELTTEGGLNVVDNLNNITRITKSLQSAGIIVSLFIDPEEKQIQAAAATGANFIEIHTGKYAEAQTEIIVKQELEAIAKAIQQAQKLGLRVNAGHGLNYHNTPAIAALAGIEELNIGHSIIARAVLVGLKEAVKEMLALLK